MSIVTIFMAALGGWGSHGCRGRGGTRDGVVCGLIRSAGMAPGMVWDTRGGAVPDLYVGRTVF